MNLLNGFIKFKKYKMSAKGFLFFMSTVRHGKFRLFVNVRPA